MDDLDELDAIFDSIGGNEKAEEVANSFNEIADGVYDAEVKKAEYKISKKGLPMVQISWGLEDGRTHNQFLMLSSSKGDINQTERNIATFVTEMRKFGLNAPKASGYIQQLDLLVGRAATLTIETNNGFTRTHIEVR